MLNGKKILLGITGSIAAYKAIFLLRLLTKAGAEVKVVMTPAASEFVSPLVLQTLSRNPVITGLATGSTWTNHVMLGRWADLMIVAPASCNTISRMASGACDNLLLAVYLSATCPVWIAPAMDEDMWKHPSTKQNINLLESYGNRVLNVGEGDLASGLSGEGRLLEPEGIFSSILGFFTTGKLAGKNALVTAGPTYEQLDPVRFVGNHSTGKMGIELALALKRAGAKVVLVAGPVSEPIPQELDTIKVTSANEMFEACKKVFPGTDIAVMAAAVADYRPKETAPEKIKKTDESLVIEFVKNPDILKYCGSNKKGNQLVVGFALETNNAEENARAKMTNKNADMIVLNSLSDPEAGFAKSTNKVTIFENNGKVHSLPVMSKSKVAESIVTLITDRLHESK
jgi:phosphopantothenoylcysteine decarboxylase/phosphopantothenate--cysteine ligase